MRGGESPVPRGMQVEIKRPLVRDTITSRCVWGEEFLENLGGPGVLMLLREQCSPGCLDYTVSGGSVQEKLHADTRADSSTSSWVCACMEGRSWHVLWAGGLC